MSKKQIDFLFRVVGTDGKYAALWAVSEAVAVGRFNTEFFPGSKVAKTELI